MSRVSCGTCFSSIHSYFNSRSISGTIRQRPASDKLGQIGLWHLSCPHLTVYWSGSSAPTAKHASFRLQTVVTGVQSFQNRSNMYHASDLTVVIDMTATQSSRSMKISGRRVVKHLPDIVYDELAAWAGKLWQQHYPDWVYRCAYMKVTAGFDGNRPWERLEHLAVCQNDAQKVVERLDQWAALARDGLYLDITALVETSTAWASVEET